MKVALVLLLVITGLAGSFAAAAAQRFPWTFGMTPEQVKAVGEYGPYRSFSNGDLETYNGLLDGRKQNFQFYFRDGVLVRISVDLYEGQDLTAAAAEWLALYWWLNQQFGTVETSGSNSPSGDGAAFRTDAQSVVRAGGKPQMAPVKQPSDAFVFASLAHYDAEGKMFYSVSLYFDPPHT